MTLIELDEKDAFQTVLKKLKLSAEDFNLVETDTTDSHTDEVLGLTGFVVITQKSTSLQAQYPIGDGSRWVEAFERDIKEHRFGS